MDATALKRARMQKGIMQKELAQKAGMPIRTLQNYESGIRTPDVYAAQRLSVALGISISELFPQNTIMEGDVL